MGISNVFYQSWYSSFIHNAQLGKIPSLKKILNLKTTHLDINFDQKSGLISDMVIQAWYLKVKTIKLLHKIVRISSEKIFKTYVKNACELWE